MIVVVMDEKKLAHLIDNYKRAKEDADKTLCIPSANNIVKYIEEIMEKEYE